MYPVLDTQYMRYCKTSMNYKPVQILSDLWCTKFLIYPADLAISVVCVIDNILKCSKKKSCLLLHPSSSSQSSPRIKIYFLTIRFNIVSVWTLLTSKWSLSFRIYGKNCTIFFDLTMRATQSVHQLLPLDHYSPFKTLAPKTNPPPFLPASGQCMPFRTSYPQFIHISDITSRVHKYLEVPICLYFQLPVTFIFVKS